MILVNKQKIIETYSDFDQISCAKYQEYLNLMKKNPSFGYKKCAKILGIKNGQTRWWHAKGPKKAVPIPLKTVEKLESLGLLPFDGNHKDAEIIFNILGTLFGDGGIDKRLNTVAFISADKKDVDLWHSDLLEIFPFVQGKIQIVEGGEYGHSFNIRCYDRAVVRFFVALGAPVGNKVSIDYSLPGWIFSSSEKARLAFLDGLLASEVSVVRYRADSRGNSRFTDFSLGLSKIEFLEQEHREFLKNVEKLLESVGVSVTGNLYKGILAGCHRKDGAFSACYRVFIRTTFHRVLYFNKIFSLRYSQSKKQRMGKVICEAIKDKLNNSGI